ncbi:hypothetical protein VTN31DRAFT_7132 [Thermomyces dupontii]|uniref:uncharacterized protein n=1 Tax=Talaromyces thermophilus TaxID=28565 RepID=UPI00374289FE
MGEPAAELPPTLETIYEANSARTSYEPIRLTTATARATLETPLARNILGHDSSDDDLAAVRAGTVSYTEFVTERARRIIAEKTADDEGRVSQSQLLHIGLAALFAFLQSNVTGPPLPFTSAEVVLPPALRGSGDDGAATLRTVRDFMIRGLSVDGEAAYQLIPNVELFCVAKALLVDADVLVNTADAPLIARTARMRVNFLHQKMLAEVTGTLQQSIYDDLQEIDTILLRTSTTATGEEKARFLLERAAIHTHHGFEAKARADLERAAVETGFEYALTGRLGKRTKFQERDISQLVVLAKSAEPRTASKTETATSATETTATKPKAVDLNDDTLLETIAFAKKEDIPEKSMTVQDESDLPEVLRSVDPSNQPKLSPLDSSILLGIASAITNSSPDHGLTREETLPYATRVIDGGSPNWQIYTQALLVRSRIERHRSRTVERSVLQMQALVDQVIADTATDEAEAVKGEQSGATTFLPRPERSESAPAEERLEYLWTLNFLTRWSLEAELAARWVDLGGLRTALEVYERLKMWPEVALCYAATQNEEKAKRIVRRQLYEPTTPGSEDDDENEKFQGPERNPLPADAPRLFCILGDIDDDKAMYERAWEVSNQRYARAQRSLARLYLKAKPPQMEKAEEAYAKSLKINPLNHSAWFAIGCVQLNLERWDAAVESFTRTVQLDHEDAEAWSNLAAALLHVSPSRPAEMPVEGDTEEGASQDGKEEAESEDKPKHDPYKHKRDALTALQHAARLKQTDHRIWDNLLTVAASFPAALTPYKEIVNAQRKVIELRSPKEGEKSIDLSILTMLVDHLVKNFRYEDLFVESEEKGEDGETTTRKILRRGTVGGKILALIDEVVTPLITHSAELWLLVARVEFFRGRPSKALEAHEKAWRAVVASKTQGAFQMGDEKPWMEIVHATERLVRDGYARIGMMDKEDRPEGSEEMVAKDWRFKARSAVRGILGKGKDFWEGSEGWARLKELSSEVNG